MLNLRTVLLYQRHWSWALMSCLLKKQWQEAEDVMEVVEEEAEALEMEVVAEVLVAEAVDSLEVRTSVLIYRKTEIECTVFYSYV